MSLVSSPPLAHGILLRLCSDKAELTALASHSLDLIGEQLAELYWRCNRLNVGLVCWLSVLVSFRELLALLRLVLAFSAISCAQETEWFFEFFSLAALSSWVSESSPLCWDFCCKHESSGYSLSWWLAIEVSTPTCPFLMTRLLRCLKIYLCTVYSF